MPENKLSNADITSEKIFEAIMTATPRMIDDVVKNILTG